MADSDALRIRTWTYAGPVEQAYERSRAPLAMVIGPTGGGKSTGSARRCLRAGMWQNPSPRDGIRRARTICICPTYRRAWDQVMPSYFKVFPQTMGLFRGSRGDPADHIYDVAMRINGEVSQVHIEVLFRAVNDLDIEEFFRGFEYTAVWLPEADTNGDLWPLLSLGANRLGRYPEPEDRPEDGAAAFTGIWGDANAPIIGSPFHTRFYLRRVEEGKEAPKTDEVYIQPSGFSVNAENMQNLRRINPDYYGDMASKLSEYDIGRLIKNRPGYGRHGRAVHPNFDQETHVATRTIDVDPYATVYVGVDCGSNALHPAATFSQNSYSGQWRTLAEIHFAEGQMTTQELGANIRIVLNSRFAGLKRDVGAMLCLDPAAASRNASSEYTTAALLQDAAGVEANLAPTNDPKLRRAGMDKLFKRSVGPGEPAKIIDPACLGLIQGYAGGFHYPKRANTFSPLPAKNEYSHVCEADEYAVLTAEGLDATEGRFIRPAGAMADSGLRLVFDD